MMRRFTAFFFIGLMTLLQAFNLGAQVKVTVNETEYQYDAKPRLANVLMPSLGVSQWYWPSTKLFRLNTSNYKENRNSLTTLLTKNKEANKKVSEAHQHLLFQINEWQLADRIQIEIDFERARYSLAHNPLFESGEYLLKLSERPTSLFIFGSITTPQTIEYINNQCIQETIKDIEKSQGADLDKVYIISPNGKIEIVGVAYWNKRCIVAMPGSSVYIPLKENQWFPKATLINQQMASLSVNRIFEK